ncbi:hypothetical protein BVIRIDIS_11680 [Blastochloris viridis]|uniref:Uncharacterized protein n=1 Tax=Blastochloris viridis TaxID=1079 RepID=A0A0S4Q2E4_BLAVI|nr:hypothetical protein BVIRIDIS_11680 [Blastochloris viridis]
MVHQDSPCAAALAEGMSREVLGPRLLPSGVVAASPSTRPLEVEPRLALPVLHGRARTALTRSVNAAAEATDAGSADGHHATGARAGWPRMATALNAMLVPLALVTDTRMCFFEPRYPTR